MMRSAGDALGSYSIHTGSVYEDCLPGQSRTHWALDTDSESRLKHQRGGCVNGTHRVERRLGDEVRVDFAGGEVRSSTLRASWATR